MAKAARLPRLVFGKSAQVPPKTPGKVQEQKAETSKFGSAMA
jgi:hypothetical protein